MNRIPLAWLFVAALPSLLPPTTLCTLPAQQPLPTAETVPVDALRAAIARVPIHDEGRDPTLGALGIWAAGRDYKCGFADGAFVLIPYLGADAAIAPAWRWQTIAATLDTALGEQDLLGSGQRRERHDPFRFERERGLVTERWDVLDHGVEQSFVVQRPAAADGAPLLGGLRLRGRITTPLAAPGRAAIAAPLSFRNADSSYRLDYGIATAIDAVGRRCAVPTSFDGDALTLHVPGAFVAAASWPLLIDPLLQPFVITTGAAAGFGELDLDAIHGDDQNQELALVWSRAASAADHDLFVFRASSDFATATQLGVELSATASSREGSITGSWIDRSIAVAWTRSTSVASSVVVKTMAANTTATGFVGSIVLPCPANAYERQPRIAAAKVFDHAPAQALCVRVRETGNGTELWATLIGTGNNQAYGTFAIAQPTLTSGSFTEPSITKGLRGDYEGWVIAYQYWSSFTSRWQVAIRRVNYVGQVDGNAVVLDGNNPSRHLMRPRIDGAFDRYLVVCSSAPTASYPGQLTSYTGTALEAQRVNWGAVAGPTLAAPRQTVRTAASRSLLVDAVAVSTDNLSHWFVGVRLASAARGLLLGYRGALIEDAHLPTPNRLGTHVAQGVMVAFSPQQQRFCALYDHSTSYQGALTWTCQGIVRAYEPLPPRQLLGGGCGLQTPNSYGEPRIGNEFFTIGTGGLAPGTWVLAGVSLASANVPFAAFGIPGGCTLRLDIAPNNLLGTVSLSANSAGYAGLRLPIPENVLPTDVYVQFVAAGATPGSLIASSGVRLSAR